MPARLGPRSVCLPIGMASAGEPGWCVGNKKGQLFELAEQRTGGKS